MKWINMGNRYEARKKYKNTWIENYSSCLQLGGYGVFVVGCCCGGGGGPLACNRFIFKY